jgi:hypothetical protein
MVIQAYDEVMDYRDLRFVKNITQGKADSFPIIGRKRDATEHTPGEQILGGTIVHDEVVITLDNMLVDSVFIAEIDELISHYELSAPYAKQLGQSLGSTTSKRIAIMHILASRETAGFHEDQPAPAYYFHADLRTSGAKLEEAAQVSQEYLRTNDISGSLPRVMLPHAQHLLLSRYSGIEGGPVTTGSGNRAQGTVGPIMGLNIQGTNHSPRTNITTGLAKYQGNFSTTVGHASSGMAVGTLERRAMKVVMKEQEDRLGTLLIASQFNGHGKLRPECAIEWRTDAIGGRSDLATISDAV